jgi:hypothetical protein
MSSRNQRSYYTNIVEIYVSKPYKELSIEGLPLTTVAPLSRIDTLPRAARYHCILFSTSRPSTGPLSYKIPSTSDLHKDNDINSEIYFIAVASERFPPRTCHPPRIPHRMTTSTTFRALPVPLTVETITEARVL